MYGNIQFLKTINGLRNLKEQKKEFITEPYKFEVDGKNVLNTTVSIPMYNKGKFVGVVGIDISLDKIVQKSF